MSKRQTLIILGIWVMIVSYLGIPSSWDRVLLLITGALIAFAAYRLNSEKGTSTNMSNKTFTDSVSTTGTTEVKS